MAFLNEISAVSKSEYSTAALYTFMLGLIVSDIVPTPADGVYFYIQRNLRNKYNNGEITPKQYWAREALAYYTLNPIYWAILMGIVISIKGGTMHKLKVASALIGAGAVAGVLFYNVKKDIQDKQSSIPKQ